MVMKKVIIGLIIFLTIKVGFSQDENFRKNEISINIFSLSKSPDNTGNIFKNPVYGTLFSNINYKRFLNSRNAIRATYYRPLLRKYKTENNNELNEQEYKEKIYLKIGYEYKIRKNNKINPYIATDILYLNSEYSKITGTLTDIGRIIESSNKNVFGGVFIIGSNFKVCNYIFLGIESNMAMTYTMEEKSSFSYCENALCCNLIYSKDDYYWDYMTMSVLLNLVVKF